MAFDRLREATAVSDRDGFFTVDLRCPRGYIVYLQAPAGAVGANVIVTHDALTIKATLDSAASGMRISSSSPTVEALARILEQSSVPELMVGTDAEKDCVERKHGIDQIQGTAGSSTPTLLAVTLAMGSLPCTSCDDLLVQSPDLKGIDRAFAEAWPIGVAKLFGCRPRTTAGEVEWRRILDELDAEFAAHIILIRGLVALETDPALGLQILSVLGRARYSRTRTVARAVAAPALRNLDWKVILE